MTVKPPQPSLGERISTDRGAHRLLERERRTMAALERLTARASLANALDADAPSNRGEEVRRRIHEIQGEASLGEASDVQDWNTFELELLQVHLMSDPDLRAELERRLIQARAILLADVAEFYRERYRATRSSAERRALLFRLTSDLQWRRTINEFRRDRAELIFTRTRWAFLAAITLFIALMAGVYIIEPTFTRLDWRLLAAACVAGGWGAATSMLMGLKERLEKTDLTGLQRMTLHDQVLGRDLIGVGGALIVYFILQSNLVSGVVFPDFKPDVLEPGTVALLIVWCFLAGFSEKLVPGLLARTEQRIGDRRGDPAVPLRPEHYEPADSDIARTTEARTRPASVPEDQRRKRASRKGPVHTPA